MTATVNCSLCQPHPTLLIHDHPSTYIPLYTSYTFVAVACSYVKCSRSGVAIPWRQSPFIAVQLRTSPSGSQSCLLRRLSITSSPGHFTAYQRHFLPLRTFRQCFPILSKRFCNIWTSLPRHTCSSLVQPTQACANSRSLLITRSATWEPYV